MTTVPSSYQLVKAVVDAFDLRIGATEARSRLAKSTTRKYLSTGDAPQSRARILRDILTALGEDELLDGTPFASLDVKDSAYVVANALDSWDSLLRLDPSGSASLIDLTLRVAGAFQLSGIHSPLDSRWLSGEDAIAAFFKRLQRRVELEGGDPKKQLAKAARVPAPTVHGWLFGSTGPTFEHLDALACRFGESRFIRLLATLQKLLPHDLRDAWSRLIVNVVDAVRAGFQRHAARRDLDLLEQLDEDRFVGQIVGSDSLLYRDAARQLNLTHSNELCDGSAGAALALFVRGVESDTGTRLLCLLLGRDMAPPRYMRLFPSPDGDASKAGLLGRARSAPPLLSDERWSASLEILAQHVIELHSMGSEQIDLRGRATVARLARRYDSAVTLYEQILELEPENELALAYGYRCAVKAHRLRRAHRFAKRLDDLGHFGPLEEMRRASSHFGRD